MRYIPKHDSYSRADIHHSNGRWDAEMQDVLK